MSPSSSQPVKPSEIIIIGGGIIGLCTAEKLVSEGHTVTLIEKDNIAAGASYGNAAGFAFSEIMPMASFSTIRRAVGWFIDPNGPFAVVPADLPHTFSWLMRFACAARPSVFKRSLNAQSQLMNLGQSTLPALLERTQLRHMVKTTGALHLYDTRAQFKAAEADWNLRAEYGVEFQSYTGRALHDFRPGLTEHIYAGIFTPDYQCVADPNDFCLAIHAYLSRQGVSTIYDRVTALNTRGASVEVTLKNNQPLHADKVILAAGPWSGELSKSLGDPVPLIGERGYNTTLPKAALPTLRYPIFFATHGFVIVPLSEGIRVGGASEIARLERAPNYQRSAVMLQKARKFIPELQVTAGKQWMGIRPTTPDTLPVIGPATRQQNILYAFGHGHLGLTQATATAQLIDDFLNQRTDSMLHSALRASRFH
jgi:D-amino-acid dehydrogenase